MALGTNPIEAAARQASNQARTQVAGTVATVRRETSIVGRASKLAGAASRALNDAAHGRTPGKKARKRDAEKKSGVYIETHGALNKTIIQSDGYVRRSPVQEIKQTPDYEKQRRAKLIKSILGVLICIGALYALFKYLGYI